ncbi:phosphatidate cytidylyltransferase [Candidatus Pelagibacter sp. HIMB1493]|uniref:phosphatidate cytidylyltransferase n=1 Tax=Candidatus Pelagibacter sp. HIMB1493 TaxID=3413334 RepID=UPI003F878905
MSKNIFRRIFTSIILLSTLLFSIFQSKLLWLLLVFVASIICIFESLNILKIFIKRNSVYYFSILLTLLYFIYFFIISWLSYSYSITFLLFVIFVVISSDSGGYIIGKLIGGYKLTKISPNKTISGSIGSFIFSLLPCLFFQITFIYSKNLNYKIDNIFEVLIYSLFLSLICQIGDLFVSYFKRKANVKHTGKILPGHGGLLDRVDGLIFVLPVAYFVNTTFKVI